MANMPTLGRSRPRPTGRIFFFVFSIVVVLVLLVGWRVRARRRAAAARSAVPTVTTPPSAAAPTTVAPSAGAPPGAADAGAAAAVAEPPKPSPKSAADEELRKAGLKRLRAEVNGPLETAVVHEVGPELGPRLVQVLVRSLVWWLAVPGDLRKGDLLEALYEERSGEDPIVSAVRYKSGKANRTFRAYRYQAAESKWPRFYMPDGQELELRLVHAPLDDYEQVTSLLRDGRGHKGVDFKTPVGTPVKAPFEATVVRKNWNWRGNGNSIELRESGGHGWTAVFLHLSEPATPGVGGRVSRGEVIAKSGNTGHSFAPHVHYQLMAGQKIIDPFAVQETTRRKLPAAQKPALSEEMERLDHLLDLPR